MDYVGVRAILGSTIDTSTFVGVVTEESERLEANVDYVLQFKIINYGTNNILDHIVYIDSNGSNLISNNLNITNYPVVNIFTDENITKQERLCHLVFQVPTAGKYRFGIARKQTRSDIANSVAFDIREVSVEKGSILQGFKDNTNDLYNFIQRCETYFEQNDKRLLLMAKKEDTNKTNAKIEVTSNNILLEVSKKVNSDAIISSINMSPESIKINANQIDMTGALDLCGTFRCYTDNSNKTGNYLYQSGAMHRGYLEGQSNPCFSSGIWNPDGTNYTGYVSVGYTNSDHIDENGCLWMSPLIGGGAHLIYSRLISEGIGSVSGIIYQKGGKVEYRAAYPSYAGDPYQAIGHHFDSSVSVENNCYYRGTGLYAEDTHLILSTNNETQQQYCVYLSNDGYFYPKGNTQLGHTEHPWYQLISTYATQVVSDMRKKKDICYIDCPAITTFAMSDEEPTVPVISREDMYEFIRDDLRLATYKLRDSKEEDANRTEIGFLAQDIMDTKIGKFIVNDNDPDNLTYDTANRVSVLEGALQSTIERVEYLMSVIEEQQDIIDNLLANKSINNNKGV